MKNLANQLLNSILKSKREMDSNGEVEYGDSPTIGWVNTTPAYAKPATHVLPSSESHKA